MAAAVADFRPRAPADTKLKKDRGVPQLELEPTEDVLGTLAARRRDDQVLVGFAAEHGDDAVANARGKLERKRLDAVVVNDISKPGIGFDAERERGDDRAGRRREPTGSPARGRMWSRPASWITWSSCEQGRRRAIEPSEQTEPAPQEFEAFAAVGAGAGGATSTRRSRSGRRRSAT